jgi:hypothetical protein
VTLSLLYPSELELAARARPRDLHMETLPLCIMAVTGEA